MTQHDYTNLIHRPGYLIRRLHQIHVSLFLEECGGLNVTQAQFAVLTVLNDGEPRDQISIASEIGIDRNTVADVIRRLAKRGLLERPPSVTDKRAKLARITKQGREFVNIVQPAMMRAQDRLTDTLNDKDYETLMQLMRKLFLDNNEVGRAPMNVSKFKSVS